MIQDCKYCSDCDVQIHVPSLEVDLAKAIESGIIPPVSDVSEFNSMDIDLAERATRIRDTFDVLEYGSTLSTASSEFSSGTGNIITPTSTPPSTPPVEGSAN